MVKKSLSETIDMTRQEKQAVTQHTQPCRVIALYLPSGYKLAKHVSPTPATLFVHTGRVSFLLGGESVELAAGESVEIPAQEAHEVDAHEASHLLLLR